MTQTIISTTQPIEQTTCATCPYFSDYREERGRGLCRIFDQVVRQHWQQTSDCDNAIKALKQESQVHTSQAAYPVMVELASKEVEDNGDGYLVPTETIKTLVSVAIPQLASKTVIAEAIAKRNYKGYSIKDWWRIEGGEEEF